MSLTGKGHATDLALILGLASNDPEYIAKNELNTIVNLVQTTKQLKFGDEISTTFDPTIDIVFNREFLPFHANGIKFTGLKNEIEISSDTYYSIGGGFV